MIVVVVVSWFLKSLFLELSITILLIYIHVNLTSMNLFMVLFFFWTKLYRSK